jgi:DNA-binding beta-propeller fold protein YncE
VANPRIAVFARLADRTVAPVRVIEGGRTRLSRTSHAIAFDEIHDEIVVPNPFSEAVLFFAGNASGDAAPIRTIQGPKTFLQENDELALDPVHGEVIVPTRQAILIFDRTSNGDVAPKRVIAGPKTKINRARGIAVDPVNNIIAVGNREPIGILIFNRTDQGDVEPRAIISGPNTGIYAPKGFTINPARKELIATNEARGVQVTRQVGESFVGVWNYSDNGDVAPKAVIKGPSTMLIAPRGAALDSAHQEIFIIDKVQNGIFAFSWQAILDELQRN